MVAAQVALTANGNLQRVLSACRDGAEIVGPDLAMYFKRSDRGTARENFKRSDRGTAVDTPRACGADEDPTPAED